MISASVNQPLDLSYNNPLDLSRTRPTESTRTRKRRIKLKRRGQDLVLSELLNDWNDKESTDSSKPWRCFITDSETLTAEDDLNNDMDLLSDPDSDEEKFSLSEDFTSKGANENEDLFVFPCTSFTIHKLWSSPVSGQTNSCSRYPDYVEDSSREKTEEVPSLLDSFSENENTLELVDLCDGREERELPKEPEPSDCVEVASVILPEEEVLMDMSPTDIPDQNSDSDDLVIDLP